MKPMLLDASAGADYAERRAWIAEYFDRTASAAWAQLTSDAPVSAEHPVPLFRIRPDEGFER